MHGSVKHFTSMQTCVFKLLITHVKNKSSRTLQDFKGLKQTLHTARFVLKIVRGNNICACDCCQGRQLQGVFHIAIKAAKCNCMGYVS